MRYIPHGFLVFDQKLRMMKFYPLLQADFHI